MNLPFELMQELQRLAAKLPELGIGPDLANLTVVEAYAMLSWLRRIAGE